MLTQCMAISVTKSSKQSIVIESVHAVYKLTPLSLLPTDIHIE